MPLFRFHRESLEESLLTTEIVKNKRELIDLIIAFAYYSIPNFNIKIKPYPDEDICLDKRIGWYTQIVTADFQKKDIYYPVGFLSEPLDE